jgi:hypothetical protein
MLSNINFVDVCDETVVIQFIGSIRESNETRNREDGETVNVQHKHKQEKLVYVYPLVEMNITVQFTGVSLHDVCEYATSPLWINKQRKLRVLGTQYCETHKEQIIVANETGKRGPAKSKIAEMELSAIDELVIMIQNGEITQDEGFARLMELRKIK